MVPGNKELNSIRVLLVKAYLKARITEFKHQNSQVMAHGETEKTPKLDLGVYLTFKNSN